MGESFFSQLLNQNNNNTVIPCPQWLPLATTAFSGLLRTIHAFTLDYTAKRHTDHIQQHTDSHTSQALYGSMSRAESARKHFCKAHGLS